MSDIKSIGIIGTGKAATFFAQVFTSKGISIKFIYGRHIEKADRLAKEFNSGRADSLKDLPACDLIILAVKDDAIATVSAEISNKQTFIVHCAGAADMQLLSGFDHYGVLYPLQSLTPGLGAHEVPLLIEANNEQNTLKLGACLSDMNLTYRGVDSATRLKYHLAAVFANNFSNAVLNATYKLGQAYHLEFDLLKPLIHSTYSRVIEGADPSKYQTGPALRGDDSTMHKHLEMLKDFPDLEWLYKQLSEYIKGSNL